MKKFKIWLLAICSFSITVVSAQEKPTHAWFNDDFQTEGYYGVSTDEAYEMLQGKKAQSIIVAVIDGGVDAMHEDLKNVMWTNPGEIAGNGIDDDRNGYVDDVHGWNFAGGKNGQSVNHDTYELTRLYAKYADQYEDRDPESLNGKEKKEYSRYLKYKEMIEEKRAEFQAGMSQMSAFVNTIQVVRKQIPKGEAVTVEKLQQINANDEETTMAINMAIAIMSQGQLNFEDLEQQIEKGVEYYNNSLQYGYNPDFRPRAEIVGDDYDNINERLYGNNDVKGPDAFHGTHVAGIIAADRTNNVGIEGVAKHVQIMGVRAVPNGDERDKDVANAIRYAVDNGASVINMSFGKGYSWNKDAVDKAVKYARKKDVLLVHAAGNSSQDNDATDNFPNDTYEKRGFLGLGSKKADNWIEVGAASWQTGADFTATFTNYGKENVDLFAPGVDIYSTAPDGGYEFANGTSMAAPVVSGVAAIIRSYFPSLSASQVKDILMRSVEPITFVVNKPGSTGRTVSLSDISVSGGTVNAAKAVSLAMRTKGKK